MRVKHTADLEPGDIVLVAGRLRTVQSRQPAGDLDWDLVLDPPPLEASPGPLRRPGNEPWRIYDSLEDLDTGDDYRRSLEQEGPGGPGGIGFRANAGRRNRKTSARVYGFGDMTFEYNSLTGDVIVTGVQLVEPLSPGKIRLSSKRRSDDTGVGVGG